MSVPGVDTVIIGTGNVAQLNANIEAANFEEPLTEAVRIKIEEKAAEILGTNTNYFQREYIGLTAPNNVRVNRVPNSEKKEFEVMWDTAYAGDSPIVAYNILVDERVVKSIEFAPQITREPYKEIVTLNDDNKHALAVQSVDKSNRSNKSKVVWI